ncbi:hypothetical protein P7C70_g1609, partial [Phenoliferia sp. Uapishka_3]
MDLTPPPPHPPTDMAVDTNPAAELAAEFAYFEQLAAESVEARRVAALAVSTSRAPVTLSWSSLPPVPANASASASLRLPVPGPSGPAPANAEPLVPSSPVQSSSPARTPTEDGDASDLSADLSDAEGEHEGDRMVAVGDQDGGESLDAEGESESEFNAEFQIDNTLYHAVVHGALGGKIGVAEREDHADSGGERTSADHFDFAGRKWNENDVATMLYRHDFPMSQKTGAAELVHKEVMVRVFPFNRAVVR